MLKILKKLNITIGDSRDEHGLERFHPDGFEQHFYGLAKMNSRRCCSKKWISFHEKNQFLFDFMIEFVDSSLNDT